MCMFKKTYLHNEAQASLIIIFTQNVLKLKSVLDLC